MALLLTISNFQQQDLTSIKLERSNLPLITNSVASFQTLPLLSKEGNCSSSSSMQSLSVWRWKRAVMSIYLVPSTTSCCHVATWKSLTYGSSPFCCSGEKTRLRPTEWLVWVTEALLELLAHAVLTDSWYPASSRKGKPACLPARVKSSPFLGGWSPWFFSHLSITSNHASLGHKA